MNVFQNLEFEIDNGMAFIIWANYVCFGAFFGIWQITTSLGLLKIAMNVKPVFKIMYFDELNEI